MKLLTLIGLGGFAGSTLRYLAILFLNSHSSISGLPTCTINILGSFLIGLVLGTTQKYLSPETATVLATGLLGGFTTFSAFSAESFTFIKEGRYLYALCYILTMVCLGVIATAVGYGAASRF